MKPGVFQGKKFPFTPKRRKKFLGSQCNNIIDSRHDLAAFRSKLANVSWLRSYIRAKFLRISPYPEKNAFLGITLASCDRSVSRQMRADFGPSFTVGRNSLKIFRISWKFLDGSTEWDPGYWPIASDPDLVLKIARNRAGNRVPSAIAQKCAFAK